MNIFKSAKPLIEISAGLTTFLSIVYILPLNATIVANTGMPFEALVIAATLVSSVATIASAFISNTPIVISVAMGLNAYFCFELVLNKQIPWQSALGAVFLSALLFFILSFTRFRLWSVEAIPRDLKHAISGGIGLFIAFIGLSNTGIIKKSEETFIALGDFSDARVLLSLLTLFLLFAFWIRGLKLGLLLALICSSLLAYLSGVYAWPKEFFALPNFYKEEGFFDIFLQIDILSALKISMIPIILSFFITQLFDSVSIISSVGVKTALFKGEEGKKKLAKVLKADAFGSLLAPIFGCTTLTTLVESEISVQSGGKTGLSSLVVGLCFLLCLFILPLFKAIPPSAIYPILILIGLIMFSEVGKIDFKDPCVGTASFFIIFMMPLCYSITLGFACGFLIYIFMSLVKLEFWRINWGVFILAFISALILILNIFGV